MARTPMIETVYITLQYQAITLWELVGGRVGVCVCVWWQDES